MLTSTVGTTADYLHEMTAGMMRTRVEYRDDLLTYPDGIEPPRKTVEKEDL